jgi:hypothetical protein
MKKYLLILLLAVFAGSPMLQTETQAAPLSGKKALTAKIHKKKQQLHKLKAKKHALKHKKGHGKKA